MKKYINVEVHYKMNDNRLLRRGPFPVVPANFIKDEKQEAARVAYEFIRQIRKESSYRITLEKVLYDGNDITEMFIKI